MSTTPARTGVLFVFDRQGRTRGAFYGAPPSLHAEAEQALAAALD